MGFVFMVVFILLMNNWICVVFDIFLFLVVVFKLLWISQDVFVVVFLIWLLIWMWDDRFFRFEVLKWLLLLVKRFVFVVFSEVFVFLKVWIKLWVNLLSWSWNVGMVLLCSCVKLESVLCLMLCMFGLVGVIFWLFV